MADREIIDRKAAAEKLRELAAEIEGSKTMRLTVIEHKEWRRHPHGKESWLTLKWEEAP
jgi:hypothetical protein